MLTTYIQLWYNCAYNGDVNCAIYAFRKVTITDPENTDGYANQGVALLRKEIETSKRRLFTDNAKSFKKAYEIVSTNSDLMANIGALKETIQQIFPRACNKEGSLYDLCLLLDYPIRDDIRKRKAEKHPNIVISETEFQNLVEEERMEYLYNADCSDSRLRFTITEKDRQIGLISSKTL